MNSGDITLAVGIATLVGPGGEDFGSAHDLSDWLDKNPPFA
ncbi:hypothetical protein [Streptomyces sp. NPDC007088]